MSTLDIHYAHLDVDGRPARASRTPSAASRSSASPTAGPARRTTLSALDKLTDGGGRQAGDRRGPAARRALPRRRQTASGVRARSSRRTGTRSPTTAGTCSTSSSSSTPPARWWAWAASAAGDDRPAARPGRPRPAVPPDEAGRGVGARALRRAQRLLQPRRAGRGRPAADAGHERPLPRLGQRSTALDFYVRQLRDMKGSVDPRPHAPAATAWPAYAAICGMCLARAHARSLDPGLLAGYLGTGGPFVHGDGRLRQGLRRPERARLRRPAGGRPRRAAVEAVTGR